MEELKKENEEKLKIPYYQAAKQALMNWNGLSEEQATKIILEQSFQEIDSQVDAKGSMDYAIEGIMKSITILPEYIEDEISHFVYEGKKNPTMEMLGKFWKSSESERNPKEKMVKKQIYEKDIIGKNINDVVMDTLFNVHDGWVKDNVKKFDQRDKKYQHMPSELIGWEEVKADLLFVKPIFEATGIKLDEEELKQVYNDRVKEFILDKGIITTKDLSDTIVLGDNFYPALEGYGNDLEKIKNPKYVNENIIPGIEKNGIGNVEKLRRRIIFKIMENPKEEDLERLIYKEQKQIHQNIKQERDILVKRKDEISLRKNTINKIMELNDERNKLKEEIREEQGKEFYYYK